MADGTITFTGHGANVVGSLGSGSLVQDMPTVWSNQYPFADETNKLGYRANEAEWNFTDAITVEFWARKGQTTDWQDASIFYKAGTFTANLGAALEYGYRFNFRPVISTAEVTVSVPVKCTANQHETIHCCATYDATTVKMYINGTLVSSSTAATGNMDTNANLMYFPKGGASYAMQGNLWDGRLWNRVLEQPEIQANFANRPTTTGSLVDNSGLVGWWPLRGDYDDISGLGYDLTDGGTTEWGSSGFNLNQIGSGSVSGAATITGGTWNLRDSSYVELDGTAGDEIPTSNTNDFELTESLSIMAWIRPNDTSSYKGIFSCCDNYSTGRNGYVMTVRNGKLAWMFADASGYTEQTGVGTINADEWQHVGITWDGSNVNSYINGVLIDTKANTRVPTYAAGDVAMIGQVDNQGNANVFDGGLFDVRLIGYAMNADEVAALYGGWADPPAMGKYFGVGKANGGHQETDSTTIPDMGNQNTDATLPSNLWVNPEYEAKIPGFTHRVDGNVASVF